MTNQINFTIVGSKGVLVKLDPLKDTTLTESGIHIPSYQNGFTDGGRPEAALSTEKFSTTGTVIAISTKAQKDIQEEEFSLSPGDRVAIHAQAKSSHNWFIHPDLRHQPVNEFDGYLLIQPSLIQAVIDNKSN